MSTTYDDVARDMAISDLHGEAVMARAALEQAIFVFVEGDSEELALPLLFTDILDLEAVGAKIANYNGHGNLRAALRLLKLTLTHDRPIVVTHDNDPETMASVRRCKEQNLLGDLTCLFPIPTEPVVTYPCGHVGGSFEESFSVEMFLNAAFTDRILPTSFIAQRASFESAFNPGKPWLRQLQKFTADLGFTDWSTCKPLLAEALATECDELPLTFSRLATVIQEVRAKHPVVHPDDVELTKVPGLTYFPEKESPNKPSGGDVK